ncbi:unnamed protein product [Pleuronectes platessa]|uniref:Uncharacterized protein n=1 Tax=Pleuronectes platessa TaxID=8262 RepID=A0A9N7Y0J2_PLEPL|nr:unnamed protein product [Pleuronectes platessa]
MHGARGADVGGVRCLAQGHLDSGGREYALWTLEQIQVLSIQSTASPGTKPGETDRGGGHSNQCAFTLKDQWDGLAVRGSALKKIRKRESTLQSTCSAVTKQ